MTSTSVPTTMTDSARADFRQLPKFLLMTGSPPGERGVGQIIVSDLCRNYPLNRLACFATLSQREEWKLPNEFAGLTVEEGRRRYERRFRPLGGAAGTFISWLGYRGLYRRHCQKLADAAVRFGTEQKCDALFAILESPTNMEIADMVAGQLNIPKYTLVWDAPDFIATHLGLTPFSVPQVVRSFGRAISGSRRVAVVSEPMARKYRADYGVDTVILRHAAPESPVRRSPELLSDTVVIGFAGSVSARPQLDLLQQTLDDMRWRIAGREVRLDVYGMKFTFESQSPRNVCYRGYHSLEATVKALSESADVLYMPQPFDKASESFTQLSFPTKLSTYFAAGRPILLHSPVNSSLGEFIRSCPFGIWCSEMNQNALSQSLQQIVTDAELRTQAVDAAHQQVVESFNAEHFRKQLHRFLGIDQEWSR